MEEYHKSVGIIHSLFSYMDIHLLSMRCIWILFDDNSALQPSAEQLTTLKSMAKQVVEISGLSNQVNETEAQQLLLGAQTSDRNIFRE